jgi:excisionase family DNA binding protein
MVGTALIKHVVAADERDSAKWVSELLARLDQIGGELKLVVKPRNGVTQEISVDKNLAEAFRRLSNLIQTSEQVSMFSDDPEVSPEQASDVLGISRPMVVQRIKCGDLKARRVGAHHRIRMSDILAFRERESEREAAMAEFSELTDEMTAKYGF